MKNVVFGPMCRVQHHVLAFVLPTLACRLAEVAIRAPNFALGDLLQDDRPAEGPAHGRNIVSLVTEVIELEDNRVPLAAVNAWMKCEVLPNSHLVLPERDRCR